MLVQWEYGNPILVDSSGSSVEVYWSYGGLLLVHDLSQDNLVATSVDTGMPSVGMPTLTQNLDELTALDILGGTPLVGTATLVSYTNLVAKSVITAAPVLTGPALTILLGAQYILVGTPEVTQPILTQNSNDLDATNILTGAPIIGRPDLSDGYDDLLAQSILTGYIVLGKPSISRDVRVFYITHENRIVMIRGDR